MLINSLVEHYLMKRKFKRTAFIWNRNCICHFWSCK